MSRVPFRFCLPLQVCHGENFDCVGRRDPGDHLASNPPCLGIHCGPTACGVSDAASIRVAWHAGSRSSPWRAKHADDAFGQIAETGGSAPSRTATGPAVEVESARAGAPHGRRGPGPGTGGTARCPVVDTAERRRSARDPTNISGRTERGGERRARGATDRSAGRAAAGSTARHPLAELTEPGRLARVVAGRDRRIGAPGERQFGEGALRGTAQRAGAARQTASS